MYKSLLVFESVETVSVSRTVSGYSSSNNGVTLKSGLGETHNHRKWSHSKAWLRFSVGVP